MTIFSGVGVKYAWNYYRDKPRVSYRKMVAYVVLTTFLVIVTIEGIHWHTGEYPSFFFLLLMALGSIWTPRFYIAIESMTQTFIDANKKRWDKFWEEDKDQEDKRV